MFGAAIIIVSQWAKHTIAKFKPYLCFLDDKCLVRVKIHYLEKCKPEIDMLYHTKCTGRMYFHIYAAKYEEI